MSPVPLLILSDAPTSGTGLGRITCDLATRIAVNMPDTFRVATAGYAGVVSRHLPFHQYILEGALDFVCPTLPDIWQDWAGDEKGYLLVIWDLQRLGWLLRPEMQCEIPVLRDFLMSKPFKIWTYLPIDSEGPNGKLTFPLQQLLQGSDRVLAYGKWGAGVLARTMGLSEGTTEYLPHGINRLVFYERDRSLSRKNFVSYTKACTLRGQLADRVKSDEVLVSIVGTNQVRKNWPLGIETVALLVKKHNVRLWIKSDILERHYSIPALLIDFGIADRTMITLGDLTDHEMACAYTASDLVLGIAPEGFGYVHTESLACGTPCVVGSYAGGAELVPQTMRVDPIAFHYETIWSCKRPVYDPADWAKKSESWIGHRATMDMKYDWINLWTEWEKWLLKGTQ
jgi:glycosyltransferase involved in cell wall biosynthesis